MFYIRLAWFCITSKKWISVTVLCSLVLAYLLPMMLLTGVSEGFDQLYVEQQKDIDRVLRYTREATEYGEELEELLQSEVMQKEEIESLSCVFNVYTDVVVADKLKKYNVYAVDENYNQFYDWKITLEPGHSFENNKSYKVCLLEEELYLQCQAQGKNPKEIFVDGTAYQVVGTTNREGIYIPYKSLKKGILGNSYVFIKLTEGHKNISLPSLLGYYMEWEAERQEMIISATIANGKTIGIILAVLFLVVVLNLIAIWREQYMQLQLMLGVQRAVGLSHFGLFLEQVVQSFFLSVGAIIVVYLFSPVLNRIFIGFGEIQISLFGLVSVLTVGVILALVQASIVTMLVYRRSIRTMLDNTP